MNILYYGMSGSAANPDLGWPLVIIGAIFTIVFLFILGHFCKSDNWMTVAVIITSICIVIGIINLIDSRRPYIIATLNDEVSFTEIQDKYQFKKKEGQLYTFGVLNVNLDEWEEIVKENH